MRRLFSINPRPTAGFTLVELLIALALLGFTATLSIPMVLSANQSNDFNQRARQAAAMVSSAYHAYNVDYGANSATTFAHLTPYLNYVSYHTAGLTIDEVQTWPDKNCTSTYPCIKLHNGAVIQYHRTRTFGGVSDSHAFWFNFDPDGVTDGTTNNLGKAVCFFLYYRNGRVVDEGNIITPTLSHAGSSYNLNTNKVPPWFSWD